MLKDYQNKAVGLPALENWPQITLISFFYKINNFCFFKKIFMTAQIRSRVWMTDAGSSIEILLRSISNLLYFMRFIIMIGILFLLKLKSLLKSF